MKDAGLTEFLDSLEGQGIPGCDCAIYHKHKPIYRHMAGYGDAEKEKPITSDTTYWLYSASKVITITAAMQLVDQGKLGLDDPVYDYIQEYLDLKVKDGAETRPTKQVMTVRHLFTMQSGLNYNISMPSIRRVVQESKGQASTMEIVKAIAEEPLDFEPGTRYQYSLSHDVLGAVIEAVSRKPFDQYLEDHIFAPLGMKDTGFVPTTDRKERMSRQFLYQSKSRSSKPMSFENIFTISENYKSGGAGLISTVDDYILFLDAMSNDGICREGYEVLPRKAIDSMRTDQLSVQSKKYFDKEGYSYGLGVRTLIDREQANSKSTLGEFGWDGAAGAYALVDVEKQLAIFYAQHVRGCDYAYQVVHPKIRDFAYEMLESI